MPALRQGDQFPAHTELKYIPIDVESLKDLDPLACSTPLPLSIDKLIEKHQNEAAHNILAVSVPGAFTPTCTANHIPPFLQNLAKLKAEKHIGVLVVLSANDAFVLNAWGKLLLQKIDLSGADKFPKVIFASDPLAKFSQQNDLSVDASANGMGIRSARFALVVDASTGKVTYLGKETEKGVHVSGVDAILSAKL